MRQEKTRPARIHLHYLVLLGHRFAQEVDRLDGARAVLDLQPVLFQGNTNRCGVCT